MPGGGPTGTVLATADGRVRLGWRLLLFVVLTVVATAVARALLPAGLLTGSVALLVGALLAGAATLRLDGRSPGALGFYLAPEAVAEAGRGLGLGAAVALVVVACIAALGGLRWYAEAGTAWAWLVGGGGALAFLAMPAAAEEALLRGYLLQALTEAWGPFWALALTSGLFAALHLFNPGVTPVATLNVGIAGVFLGVVYLRTASLWWATGAHLGWNWAHGYLADVPVSGLELLDAPLYEGVARGAPLVSGGAFGPEGSLVTTGVVTLAAGLCWRASWMGTSEPARAVRPLVLTGPGQA